MFLFSVPVLLLILFLTVFLYDHFNRLTRLASKMPGPWALPIVGNSFHFLLSPVELFKFVRTLPKDYGAVYSLFCINARIVGVVDPEYIKTILSSIRYTEKRLPYNFLKPWLNEGLLISNGHKWHQRRKLLTPAFHFNILKKYSRTFIEKGEKFLEQVQEKVGEEKTDVTPLIAHTTLRIMCETAMGTSMQDSIETVANKYLKAIEIVGNALVQRTIRIWLYLDSVFKWTDVANAQKEALKDLHVFTTRIIEERRKFLKAHNINVLNNTENDYGSKGKLAMLDLLLANEKLGNIDDKGIREEVDTFMFEGHDTTATALSFMLIAIANEPSVQDKIYQEQRQIYGESQRPPTIEDLNDMKYLELCIKESLRLYPSVPMIMRNINEDIQLGNHLIPGNSQIVLSIYDLHRRSDIYPEPERFIPERFLPENCAKRHPYAYIPFSAGPRNCIGQKFAMMEMKTLMSVLLRRFCVDPVTKPSDLVFNADIILRNQAPMYVRFRNRQ